MALPKSPEDLRATLLHGSQPNEAHIVDFLAPSLSSPHSLLQLIPQESSRDTLLLQAFLRVDMAAKLSSQPKLQSTFTY